MKMDNGFKCTHCGQWVIINEFIGTKNRNHCPNCLWSKHVDREKPGDRKSSCFSQMPAIGLTFKKEGQDKYGRGVIGELMIIHQCNKCQKISINRIAADDNTNKILELLNNSSRLTKKKQQSLRKMDIIPLDESNRQQISLQLFGSQTSP